MPDRAVYSFLGYPGWGPLHLHLHDDGSPAEAALRLGAALAASAGHQRPQTALVSAFLRLNPQSEPLGSPHLCGAGTAHYVVVHRLGGRWPQRITGWWPLPDQGGWSRPCGPLPLDAFVRRFHPGRHRPPPERAGSGPA